MELKPGPLWRALHGEQTFNRTTMELKLPSPISVRVQGIAFNRTTMELKPYHFSDADREYEAFNRTTMELKRGKSAMLITMTGAF